MANLKAGLIGLGVMGSHHARVLDNLDGVELCGIVDPVHTGSTLAGLTVEGSVGALLDRGVDYCVVAAPTASHADIALKLARSGVHALIEKPVALTVSEALGITQAFAEARLVGAVGHIERFNPAIGEMRRRIADNQIGRILQIATRRQGPFPSRIGDVGVVKDLATHDLDLTTWVTGQSYLSVAAQAAYRTGRPHEDMVSISGALSDGTVVNHLVNWLSPFKERRITVTGEGGALVADTLTGDLTYFANGLLMSEWEDLAVFRGVTEGDILRYAIPKAEPLLLEHEAFRDAVLGLPADIVSLESGMEVVAVSEAILTSIHEQRTVLVGQDAAL